MVFKLSIKHYFAFLKTEEPKKNFLNVSYINIIILEIKTEKIFVNSHQNKPILFKNILQNKK